MRVFKLRCKQWEEDSQAENLGKSGLRRWNSRHKGPGAEKSSMGESPKPKPEPGAQSVFAEWISQLSDPGH